VVWLSQSELNRTGFISSRTVLDPLVVGRL
jgi:hypothetical protein